MKTYYQTPLLNGMLSDDYLYFEGASRPQAFYVLCERRQTAERGSVSQKEILELEGYFNDMYNLFLRKLTSFVAEPLQNDETSLKLQALLQELIKVKDLIENAGRVDIMGE